MKPVHTIAKLQDIVGKELLSLNLIKEPVGLYEPINYLMNLGGKHIRPTLVLMGCNLFSDDITRAIKPSIGVELFHNFTLMHDDIMDNAPLRRGKPTVHKKWNENTAILSGDAMLIKAYQQLMNVPDNILRHTLDLFNQTAIEVCEGQLYDMNFESRLDVSEDEYIEMIRLKTAVLLGASLEMGAIISEANKKDTKLIYNFGQYIGLAFQLQDDILDVYGDPKTFGKQVGGDIISNKKTYLLIKALELSDKEDKEKLLYLLNQKDFIAEEKIKAVMEIYQKVGVKKLSENKMYEFATYAIDSLNAISVDNSRKSQLLQFANDLLVRTS